ncbi:MAG: prepilin-type N-terminal cleavage/methylation domain-containing protein [Candidatus Omnitrophica bacterium]|nr:prepilin-type N-terminal cleavage/methylation domain-containing protein [Candidatus Omnitrophota bacterium]
MDSHLRGIVVHSCRGFTMIEMLVSVAVFLLVMSMAFATLLAATEVRRAAAARIDIYQNARSALGLMAQELRSAKLYEDDLRFAADPGGGVPADLNEPDNGRGRLLINDWPPDKDRARTLGVDVNDKRIFTGNGIDDDGDGETDEEAFDGLDNDGDGEPSSPMHPILQVAMADGIDNNGDGRVDEGIDEDFFFPRDMINFLTSRRGREIEVGYAMDTLTRRDLLRRTALLAVSTGSARLDGLYPIAVQYALAARGAAQPQPVPGISPDLLVPWFDQDFDSEDPNSVDRGEEPREVGIIRSNAQRNQPHRTLGITQVYEVMALNILGVDFKAYYYDHLIGEENGNFDPNAPRFSPPGYNPYSFPALSWDSSIENSNLRPYPLNTELDPAQILPNEPNDLAVIGDPGTCGAPPHQRIGTKLFFEHCDVNLDRSGERAALATDRTDGFPRIIEITLFVQDQNRLKEDPVRVSTRVMLPFGTGDN